MKKTLIGIFGVAAAIFQLFSKQSSRAWWVKIQTQFPEFTYYFGPFESQEIANQKLPGFVEDLQAERAQITSSIVEWCNPPQITVEGTQQPV